MIDTRGFAFPKPAHQKGQLKLKGAAYTKHKRKRWTRQGERCAKCGRSVPVNDTNAHHPGGRGLGGSKRDDRKIRVLCADCHIEVHQN